MGHTRGDDLAEAMRKRWADAVDFLRDPRQCRVLGSWLRDLHGREREGARVVEDAARDPELALVRLLAGLRPDLPPVLRGRDMTLTSLTNRVRTAHGLFLETGVTVEAGVTVETVEALSGHHCAEPDHECGPFPCQAYRGFAADLRAASEAAARTVRVHNPWLSRQGWAGHGPVDVASPGFLGLLLTALLNPRQWRARTRTASRVGGRWAALVPAAKVSGDPAEAAGVEAVHLRVCEALVELSGREAGTAPRLAELRGYHRAVAREGGAVLVCLVLGLALVAWLNLGEVEVSGPVVWTLAVGPLIVQQLVFGVLRGWRRRTPPAWVVVEQDGPQATVQRLVERLEGEQGRLDASFRDARSKFA
ncbi:hypothetical protein ABZ635_24160 [Nocardiopsis sp. NPDC007018]|uniref:hypothetical protein n=1 Tax=Nocardiopsis sp. NPDC007018 TaxID=3155721 RepID=UPI00340B2C23